MELSGVPAREARLMARIAIGDCDTGQCLVGDVVGNRAIGWREGASVASAALIGDNRLRVVPLARRPARHIVAGAARGGCRNMGTALARGRTAVVAACAVGRSRERAVVHFGTEPAAGGLVASLAIARDGGMNSRGGLGSEAIRATQMAACALI